MDTYQQKLYWHIRRLVTVHADTDDVLQLTLIKAYRNIGSFKRNSKLYSWLYRIATNESLTFIKSRNRRQSQQIDGEDSLESRLQSDPYWEGDQAELILQKAMQTLPEKQLLVFQLRYYDEMPYQQMSDMLGTSEGGLKASYHLAVKKVEDYIRTHGSTIFRDS